MILWYFHATFVNIHELRAFVHTWIMMFFGSAQWSCYHERHKCRFITSIREYFHNPACIFSLKNLYNVQFQWIISLSHFQYKITIKINQYYLKNITQIDHFQIHPSLWETRKNLILPLIMELFSKKITTPN